MTPLHVAARDGRTKVVRLLLSRARCSSSVLRDVLFVASGSVRGRPEVVALIERALEDAAGRPGGATLFEMARDGRPERRSVPPDSV